MTRIVVAIDPAMTSGDAADETGIVGAGKDKNGHGYVLADLSGRYPPTEWARLAITAYATHGADRVVAEVNNGGDMVGATLRMVDPNVAFTAVRASRGKVVRAEPVAALYQQGRVHHIGTFPQLEDQMTNFTSDIDRAALTPWYGRSANCWSSRWKAKIYMSFTAGKQKLPSSVANRNPPKLCTPGSLEF